MKKTSQDWFNNFKSYIQIIDYDGWDQEEYHYSWFKQEITFKEFLNRLLMSNIKYKKHHCEFQELIDKFKDKETMDSNEYLNKSERTAKSFPDGKHFDGLLIDLLHAGMGMDTESAEFTDMLKKHIFYNKPLDITNLKEELGDLCWYVALALRTLETTFEEIMHTNISKLEIRYPEKFSEHHALNRDLETERKTLEF